MQRRLARRSQGGCSRCVGCCQSAATRRALSATLCVCAHVLKQRQLCLSLPYVRPEPVSADDRFSSDKKLRRKKGSVSVTCAWVVAGPFVCDWIDAAWQEAAGIFRIVVARAGPVRQERVRAVERDGDVVAPARRDHDRVTPCADGLSLSVFRRLSRACLGK